MNDAIKHTLLTALRELKVERERLDNHISSLEAILADEGVALNGAVNVQADSSSRIVDLIKRVGRPMTSPEIRDGLGFKGHNGLTTVNDYLLRAMRQDLIVRVGRSSGSGSAYIYDLTGSTATVEVTPVHWEWGEVDRVLQQGGRMSTREILQSGNFPYEDESRAMDRMLRRLNKMAAEGRVTKTAPGKAGESAYWELNI